MPLLETRRLVKSYRGRGRVVKGVSFDVEPGEIVGLLGPNGAGKTTTFRMTVGMIRPEEGEVRFGGHDVSRLPMYRRARRGMGYLSQEPSIFRGLTVEQNVLAVLETLRLSRKERRNRLEEHLAELGLQPIRKTVAHQLSGGEKRRLEITRSLVTSPRLLLLDEPFSGVDPIAVSEIQDIVVRLRERGMGILLTDHNVRETLTITDRAYIIFEGEILRQGTSTELVEDPVVREVYLGERFRMGDEPQARSGPGSERRPSPEDIDASQAPPKRGSELQSPPEDADEEPGGSPPTKTGR